MAKLGVAQFVQPLPASIALHSRRGKSSVARIFQFLLLCLTTARERGAEEAWHASHGRHVAECSASWIIAQRGAAPRGKGVAGDDTLSKARRRSDPEHSPRVGSIGYSNARGVTPRGTRGRQRVQLRV